jgi:large subunit ribosomal protein L13
MLQKTYQPKETEIKREWHFLDAKGKVLGRLASQIATLLMGKHKKTYTPHLDMGDWVVVKNAKDVKVTGKKELLKIYYHHSGYPGGLKKVTFAQLREKNPAKIIELAVRRMLPANRLRDKRMKRLKVFVDEAYVQQK